MLHRTSPMPMGRGLSPVGFLRRMRSHAERRGSATDPMYQPSRIDCVTMVTARAHGLPSFLTRLQLTLRRAAFVWP